MEQINYDISLAAAQQRLPLLKKCSSFQFEKQQKLHQQDEECRSEYTQSTQGESANCEDYTCVAAFTPIGETFDEILTVELQLPIKTSKCQPREESYLGKRKFYQTCLNKRQVNKPSKLRRKEKKFHTSVHASQASSLCDLLAMMDS